MSRNSFKAQAYTSLAAGYDGISWYKYTHGGYGYSPIDREQNINI